VNINTETAMIISGAIGAGASLLMFLITGIFNARSGKRKERERFFYEIYRRRLALYRKILKKIYLFSDLGSSAAEAFGSPQKFGQLQSHFLSFRIWTPL
jgi:ABC-type siderophore export system fused ATPase/permease subunit